MAAAALSASSFVAPTRVRVARRPVVQSRGYARATTSIRCLGAPPSRAKPRATCFTAGAAAHASERDANAALARARMVVRADGGFIGSSTNLIMVASTGLILAAGRFGLAPSANRLANAGLKLSEKNQGQLSGDPAGFTASDVLYGGSVGHIIGAGIVLGLRGVGAL